LEPNSLKSVEREEASTAPPSVCASVVAAAAGTGEGAGAASVLGVLGAFAALGAASLEGAATGVGAATAAGAGEEEVFFAILSWYTLIGEVFLSIFRPYILYLAFLLKKDSYYRHKIPYRSPKNNAFILL
jgi:hypothetical protein